MPTRPYVSSVRAAAAAEKRKRVLQAAARFLREEESIAGFSLDAVARAAGVTRLTVYHQFGSRRGLLEAVFDEIAVEGGLIRLNDAMARADPWEGLDCLVEIFCGFWSRDPALGRLHDVMAIDPEFAQAVLARNERRRETVDALLKRIVAGDAPASARRDAADLIFALTGYAIFRILSDGRGESAVCQLLKLACRDAVYRITGRRRRAPRSTAKVSRGGRRN